jgi:hypothetical protein
VLGGGIIGVLPLPSREAPTMPSPNVATILRDHVSLSTACIDRLYLNGYVPKLQSTSQLCAFLCDPAPSCHRSSRRPASSELASLAW